MPKSFYGQILKAPQSVIDYTYGEEFWKLYEELIEKFEIKENSKKRDILYLLYDILFKVFEPISADSLKEEIIARLNLETIIADQMAYYIYPKLVLKIKDIWEAPPKEEKKPEISYEDEYLKNLIKKIKETQTKYKPSRILNLQKVIPPKQKEEKVQSLDLKNIEIKKEADKEKEDKLIRITLPSISEESLRVKKEEMPVELEKKEEEEKINIQIPLTKAEGLKTRAEIPKTEEQIKKEEEIKVKTEKEGKVVILKEQRKEEEGVIDLSAI